MNTTTARKTRKIRINYVRLEASILYEDRPIMTRRLIRV